MLHLAGVNEYRVLRDVGDARWKFAVLRTKIVGLADRRQTTCN